MRAQTDPPLKMMWVERGNPVTQNPETHTVLESIRALDFRVVVEQFMTDTAAMADIVLPATTQIEQHDAVLPWGHLWIGWNGAAIDPPGEARSDHWFWIELGKRFDMMFYPNSGHGLGRTSQRYRLEYLAEHLLD